MNCPAIGHNAGRPSIVAGNPRWEENGLKVQLSLTESQFSYNDKKSQKRAKDKQKVNNPTTMTLGTSALCLAVLLLQATVSQAKRLGEQGRDKYIHDETNEWQEFDLDAEQEEGDEFWSRFLEERSSMAPPAIEPPASVDRCANVTCTNPVEGCDPFDGQCKPIDAIVPCIAIIDESSVSDFNVEQQWRNFRTQYPDRPFCLLRPLSKDYLDELYLPPAFVNDTRTTFADVSRDDLGDQSIIPGPSDWFTICGFGVYMGSDVEFIGKFLDTSGSMTRFTVADSENLFLEKVSNSNLVIREVFNGQEDWITPFLTTLVPSSQRLKKRRRALLKVD